MWMLCARLSRWRWRLISAPEQKQENLEDSASILPHPKENPLEFLEEPENTPLNC